MNNQPTITIITPVYNTGKFVIKALECIKKQTFRDFEHIIIDDCSKDNSIALIEDWIKQNDHKCVFLKNEKNKGLCATLNIGKKMAKGRYVNGLGDDEWTADYLERRISHFETLDDTVGMTISDAVLIDEQSNVIAKSWYEKRGSSYEVVINSLVYPEIMYFNYIIAPSAIVRRSVYDHVGFHDERLTVEDYDMWFRISQKYKIVHFPEPLISYRRRANSLSKAPIYKDKFIIDWLMVYEKNLEGLKLLKKAKRFWRRHAIDNYSRNKDTRLKWFWISLKLNKDIISLLYLCLCLLKINPDHINRIKAALRENRVHK